jgi:hypothetical protein
VCEVPRVVIAGSIFGRAIRALGRPRAAPAIEDVCRRCHRLPPVVDGPHEVADERDVVRLHRLAEKLHPCVVGRPVAFIVIALDARRDEIFPRVFTTAGFGNDVIHGEAGVGSAAVLTAVTVAAQDVLTGENNFLVGDLDVDTEADDAGKRHSHGDRMKFFPIVLFDKLGLSKIQKNDRFLDITHTHRLVVLIEDEDLAAELNV